MLRVDETCERLCRDREMHNAQLISFRGHALFVEVEGWGAVTKQNALLLNTVSIHSTTWWGGGDILPTDQAGKYTLS